MVLQVAGDRRIVLHFFIKQLTLEQFCTVEKACFQSTEYGNEVSSFPGGCDNDYGEQSCSVHSDTCFCKPAQRGTPGRRLHLLSLQFIYTLYLSGAGAVS